MIKSTHLHPDFSFRTMLTMLFALCLWVLAPHAQAQSIRPLSDRLDAIVSYPLVIAIMVEDERDLRSGVIAKLDDGRVMQCQAYWVGISPQNTLPSWTSPAGIWTATDYKAINKLDKLQRPTGTWFIEIPMPIDAVGQGLWIAGERYELNWLPDPSRTRLEAAHAGGEQSLRSLWSLKLTDQARQDPAVQAAIEHYRQDPFQHWRMRLLTDGLNPDHRTQADPSNLDALELELALDTPGADLLRELARQYEARWQIILGRIWLIDPSAAIRLKSQLISTAKFGDRTLPLWPSDTAELARLSHDLLSPFVNDRTRVLRANAWLDTQPRALAWVSDDQGTIEAGTNRFLPTVSVVSLPQTAGSSLFRLDTQSTLLNADPVLTTRSSHQAFHLSAPIELARRSPTNPLLQTADITVRTGHWNTTQQVIASPTSARAPYVNIGPLLNDWTMRSLYKDHQNQSAEPSFARSAKGLLRRTTPPTRTNQTAGWQLYFELGSPNPASENESLTLWIGPYSNPFAVWKITPNAHDGQLVDFIAGSRLNIGIPKVQTRTLNSRWIVMIDLPAGAFDEDMLLQLGLERTDADGIHTAWPRRMLPDQPEPGRLTIEADNFDNLLAD